MKSIVLLCAALALIPGKKNIFSIFYSIFNNYKINRIAITICGCPSCPNSHPTRNQASTNPEN
jgi:hypothetical protein